MYLTNEYYCDHSHLAAFEYTAFNENSGDNISQLSVAGWYMGYDGSTSSSCIYPDTTATPDIYISQN